MPKTEIVNRTPKEKALRAANDLHVSAMAIAKAADKLIAAIEKCPHDDCQAIGTAVPWLARARSCSIDDKGLMRKLEKSTQNMIEAAKPKAEPEPEVPAEPAEQTPEPAKKTSRKKRSTKKAATAKA